MRRLQPSAITPAGKQLVVAYQRALIAWGMAITPRDKKPGEEGKEPAFDIHVEGEPGLEVETRAHEEIRRMVEQQSGSALGRALEEAKQLLDPSGGQRTELQKALGATRDFAEHHEQTFGALSSLNKLGEEYAQKRRETERLISESVHVLPAIRSPFPSKMEVELTAVVHATTGEVDAGHDREAESAA